MESNREKKLSALTKEVDKNEIIKGNGHYWPYEVISEFLGVDKESADFGIGCMNLCRQIEALYSIDQETEAWCCQQDYGIRLMDDEQKARYSKKRARSHKNGLISNHLKSGSSINLSRLSEESRKQQDAFMCANARLILQINGGYKE